MMKQERVYCAVGGLLDTKVIKVTSAKALTPLKWIHVYQVSLYT